MKHLKSQYQDISLPAKKAGCVGEFKKPSFSKTSK